MKILLFDMDGVLLKANGYHRALQETVRLAGQLLDYQNILLSAGQIAKFEALGISSEWHSSALCMAVLAIQKEINPDEMDWSLDLNDLFDALSKQSIEEPALERACKAVEELAKNAGVSSKRLVGLVKKSESILDSVTLNWFQELVLGSEIFSRTYQKAGQFETDSYLSLYDEKMISEDNASKILTFSESSLKGAAIMTNRPSNALSLDSWTPEAELGAALVGLEALPLVGYGEIVWMANEIGREAGELNKPAWQHAMAAILMATGWPIKESLRQVGKPVEEWNLETLKYFHESTTTVFEDTPGGIIAVQEAGKKFNQLGLDVKIRKIGIAIDEPKQTSLTEVGAEIYPSVDVALAELDYF